MGCVVNAIGEAAHADVAIAYGKGKGLVMVKGEVVVHPYDLTATQKITYGTSLGLIAGLAKELYDEHIYNEFDINDLAYDTLGSFSGALSSYYLLNWVIEPSQEQIKISYNLKF